MKKKQRFVIRKLSVGVVSACIGFTLISDISYADNLKSSSQSTETNESVSQTDVVNSVSSGNLSTDYSALDILESSTEFTNDMLIRNLSSTQKIQLNEILLANFETKADEVALKDIVSKPTSRDTLAIFTPLVAKMREEAKKNGENINDTVVNQRIAKEAMAEAQKQAEAAVYEDVTLEAIAASAKPTFSKLLDSGLLSTNPNLTIGMIKEDLHLIYRGILYLQQQYSFEDGLVEKLITSPHTISNVAEKGTSYSRLKEYGMFSNKAAMTLRLNQTQYEQKLAKYTGIPNVIALIEKLAQNKGQEANIYFENQTQALVGSTNTSSTYEVLKANKPELLVPILAQGKGIYVGTTRNSVSLGLLATYVDQNPELSNWSKDRGQGQPTSTFFDKYLEYQENFIDFLDDVKKVKDPIPFTVALDSMNVWNEQKNKLTWSPNKGTDADSAVINFFDPLKYWQEDPGFIGGIASGKGSITTVLSRLMNNDLTGIGLFTHEMTHINDEAALFAGNFQSNGRRQGQGAEVYARGLFEVIDNSQNGKAGEYKPVFNLNTAIEIPEGDGRIQASKPLKTKQELENYTKNLIDLIAYLEVKEAEVALANLTSEEKSIYFNRVIQTSEVAANISNKTRASKNKLSTNDAFLPYGTLGTGDLGNPTTVADLVSKDAVSGQFIPRAVSPIIANVTHNQYDHVPLLESFYGVQQADADKQTVGDISFKRHAYEILAWKGYDAFIEYLSDQHNSDQEAFASILKEEGHSDWASYKQSQYERLSTYQPVNKLWNENDLEIKLKQAIEKDLAILTSFRKEADVILQDFSDNTQSQLNNLAIKHNLQKTATAVRQVKLEILKSAIQYNDLQMSVLEPSVEAMSEQTQTYELAVSVVESVLNKYVDRLGEIDQIYMIEPATLEYVGNELEETIVAEIREAVRGNFTGTLSVVLTNYGEFSTVEEYMTQGLSIGIQASEDGAYYYYTPEGVTVYN